MFILGITLVLVAIALWLSSKFNTKNPVSTANHLPDDTTQFYQSQAHQPEDPQPPNEITQLNLEQAEQLVRDHCGDALYLDSLTTLSDDVARVLAKHNGNLYLAGLSSLSDEVAKALAQHMGCLYLTGLSTLSDDAAKLLAQHKGKVYLDGLTLEAHPSASQLSNASTEAFGEYVYTRALVTVNRWTGAVALALAAIALILGPVAAVAIGLKNTAADGWALIGGAFAYGVALAAVGLSAYVVAELLTMAVRVVSVLRDIDAKLGSGPLATAVPPKSDVNPDEPPKA